MPTGMTELGADVHGKQLPPVRGKQLSMLDIFGNDNADTDSLALETSACKEATATLLSGPRGTSADGTCAPKNNDSAVQGV